MKYAIVNFEQIKNDVASIHRAGCRAIQDDLIKHGGHVTVVECDTPQEALDFYLDEEMKERGYGENDVKIHNCTRVRR